MAITQTRTNADGGMRFASGTIVDTAANPAALDIELGFVPHYFKLVNLTDGDFVYEGYLNAAGTAMITVKDADGTKSIPLAADAVTVELTGSGNQSGTPGTPQAGTSKVTDDTRTQTVGSKPTWVVTIGGDVLEQNHLYRWLAIGAF